MQHEIQDIEHEIEQLEAHGVRITSRASYEDPAFQPTDDAITLEYLYHVLNEMRGKCDAGRYTSS